MQAFMGPADIPEGQVRAQVRRIVASSGFVAAENVRRLLEFTVDKTLRGHADEIKEFTLGLEVFGRKASSAPMKRQIRICLAARLLFPGRFGAARGDRFVFAEGRNAAPEPEPSAWALLGSGLGCLLIGRKSRSRSGNFLRYNAVPDSNR